MYTKSLIKWTHAYLITLLSDTFCSYYNKLYANFKKPEISLNYANNLANEEAKAETLFPLRKRSRFLTSCYFLLTSNSAVWAQTSALETALTDHIQTEIRQYAAENKLDRYEQELAISLPDAAADMACEEFKFEQAGSDSVPLGRVSYRIDCLSPQTWQSRAVAKIEIWAYVVVATQTLERGDTLSNSAIGMQSRALSKIYPAPMFNISAAIGKQTKRRIPQGDAITLRLLNNPQVIQKGEHVTLVVNQPGFSASIRGIALADAKLGEKVKVQNLTSGQIVEGVAIQPGLVETELKNN